MAHASQLSSYSDAHTLVPLIPKLKQYYTNNQVNKNFQYPCYIVIVSPTREFSRLPLKCRDTKTLPITYLQDLIIEKGEMKGIGGSY